MESVNNEKQWNTKIHVISSNNSIGNYAFLLKLPKNKMYIFWIQ